MTFEDAVRTIQPGRYCHFKGNAYEVVGIARHSETEEPMVVYRALYGEGGLWVCPAEMWNETVERDGKVASTIFCSQFSVRGWQDKIGDPILADAICDRIVHDSYTLVVEGKESMRKRKGIPEDT